MKIRRNLPRVAAAVAALALSAPTLAVAATQPKRLAVYYPEWGIYARNFLIKDIDNAGSASKITHLLYAFAKINPPDDNHAHHYCALADAWADYETPFTGSQTVSGVDDGGWGAWPRGNFHQILELKAKYPQIVSMISMGGANGSGLLPVIASTAENRQAFVASCVDMFIKGNLNDPLNGTTIDAIGPMFDGVDIDWEYPGPDDKANFTLLVQEFRTQLDAEALASGRKLKLSITTGSTADEVASLQLKKLQDSVNFINLLTYDFHGTWSSTTGLASSLYVSKPDPVYNADYVVDLYLSKGVDPMKLNLGIPFYGRGWAGVPSTNNGLRQTSTGAATGVFDAGVNDFKALNPLLAEGYEGFIQSASHGYWIYSSTQQVFWTFDSKATVKEKGKYVTSKGLGGADCWDVSGDDANGTLVSALRKGLDAPQ